MSSNNTEESSDDENAAVSEITQELQICSLEEKISVFEESVSLPSHIKVKAVNDFHYSTGSSVEYAKTFNRNLPLESSDPFLKKLRKIVKECPFIERKPLKKDTFSNKKIRISEPATFVEQSSGHDGCIDNSRQQVTKASVGFNEKYKTSILSGAKHPPNELGKITFNDFSVETSMSEPSKSKGRDLIRTLCDSDDASFSDIFLNHKQDFLELLPQVDNVPNLIPHVIEVILKVFHLEHPSRRNILFSLICDEFIGKIVSYITLLPTDCEESLSKVEIETFFHNILLFCENMKNAMPLKFAGVLHKLCLSLLYAGKGLKEVQNFNLDEKLQRKINDFLEESNFQRLRVPIKKKKEGFENVVEPPNNVKDIEIFPSKKDLFEPPTFLRKNVVNGSYRDASHYVDVHFRLLREDFIAPLRNGIQLYCESIDKGHQNANRRFENILIHEDVKILHGTITSGRFGHLVQLSRDFDFNRGSKRFMFGSLVLFTADNFDSFFCGTVISSAENNLLVVDLWNYENCSHEIYTKVFTMVESEVYFEPYFHVLTALQKFDCATFPMNEYIVNVQSNTAFQPQNMHIECPSSLNESQKQAFKSAMVDEFVVIQGPPGTGKTFLAEAITKTLLLSQGSIIKIHTRLFFDLSDYVEEVRFYEYKKELWRKEREEGDYFHHSSVENELVFHDFFCELEQDSKPILVICYTNHALDQFLERLVSLTKRLIRVGGQSKNRSLEHFNLKEIRRCWIKAQTFIHRKCGCGSCCFHIGKFNYYFEHKKIVQEDTCRYLVYLKILEGIALDGVLKLGNLTKWMSPRQHKALFYQQQYESWLMEGANHFHIEDEEHNDQRPEPIVNTQQLLSELRESHAYRNDLEIYDTTSIDSSSTDEADENFFLKCSNVISQIKNTQNKLRKCRQKGGNRNRINLYENQIRELENQRRYISYMLAHPPAVDLKRIRDLNRTANVWEIGFEDRWMLYNYWAKQYENEIKNKMFRVEMNLKTIEQDFTETRDEFDLQLLKSANILGMTTTSAARLRNMLTEIGPEIVLVEEAAEVLESHIIAALNPSVKKVILIGDHKQLQPNPAVYELARQYQLDVSLFERMINNGLACRVLDTQQRMRPEIASLISPAIYPDLKNGERVLDRPDIRGVAANVFFVTHNVFEDECFGENRSHRNFHEVDFLMSFCQYLLRQDYYPSQITILATYLGQMTALENERRRRNLSCHLRITTVDNYQGEENDIILLSLVRSNAEARIGFLSKENRVCVALSRAKNGLYMIGNMDNLTQSNTIWRQVKAQLESMNAIGPALPLGCKTHPNDKCLVSCSKDFKEVPVSGCKLKCGARLSCGHVCSETCHSTDPEHTDKFVCRMPCERIMPCGEHMCTKLCGSECGSCSVIVEKQLPCGHSAHMWCSANPQTQICRAKETLVSDVCGHVVSKLCHQKIGYCEELCTGTMDCGHPCTSFCHAHLLKNDKHQIKHCYVEVEKTLGCGHTFTTACKNSNQSVLCKEPCPKTLPCGHPCENLCSGPCSTTCNTLIEKTLSPCGHQLMLPCGSPAESAQCRQPCELTLPCGHRCRGVCSADCSRFTCQEAVLCSIEPACAHGQITIPCFVNTKELQASSDQLLQYCRAPCRADLPCGHSCVGRCGDCLQGRLHIPCSYPCAQVLKCGHRCERDCCNECPSMCDRPCLYQCPHQTCQQLCGDPCTPCQRMCGRRCRHQRCSRVCGEDCDIPPCDEPCLSTLPCGHPCPGYCGEPCTRYCRVCQPEVFDIPGHATAPSDRYVTLEDCGHPVEDGLLRKLLLGTGNLKEVKKCPICDEPIRFALRFKDHIREIYKNLASAKKEENVKFANFESKMKTEKYSLKFYSNASLEQYGDNAFFILEHLKKAPLVYKTSMRVFTFFKHLTKRDGLAHEKHESWNEVVERRKLLLGALALRLNSMSHFDYSEFLTEIFRLDIATKNWPTHRNLLLSLKKYSQDELKALE